MILLPAIDIIGGLCVRLTEGDYSRRSDYGLKPSEAASSFAQQGAEWIHLVDLDGAKAGRPINLEALSEVRRAVDLKLEVGGGVRTREDAEALLAIGIDRVILGTAVVSNPALATEMFSALGERAVGGLDLRDGRAATHGWTEVSSELGLDLAKRLQDSGCRRFIVTDIATDGAFTGPNLSLMEEFAGELEMPVIASGGVSTLDDLEPLSRTGVEGVIVGKALYEGRMTVREALAEIRRTSHSSPGAS